MIMGKRDEDVDVDADEPEDTEVLAEEKAAEVAEDDEDAAPTPPSSAPRPLVPFPVMPTIDKAAVSAGSAVWGEPAPKPKPKNDMSDLFAVPQPEDNDVYTDDLVEYEPEDVEMEDDLSDLTRVTNEDVMGRPPKPRPRYRRTTKQYDPNAMGGVG